MPVACHYLSTHSYYTYIYIYLYICMHILWVYRCEIKLGMTKRVNSDNRENILIICHSFELTAE